MQCPTIEEISPRPLIVYMHNGTCDFMITGSNFTESSEVGIKETDMGGTFHTTCIDSSRLEVQVTGIRKEPVQQFGVGNITVTVTNPGEGSDEETVEVKVEKVPDRKMT